MKKNILLLTLIVLIFIIPFLITIETDIYLNLSDYKRYESIDMRVEIDKKTVFKDTVVYSAFKPMIVKYPMKFGFHKVKVSSKVTNTAKQKTIFLFFRQYLLIEFFDKEKYIRDEPDFLIETNFKPYYIE